MKSTKLVLFAFFGLLIFADFASAQFGRNGDQVALYRLFNESTGDHLYTTSCDERDRAEDNLGYRYEGIAGYVASRQIRNTVPLYRVFVRDRGHFYTTDYNEVSRLTRSYDNKDEGITGYVSNGRGNRTVPFYRIDTGRNHFFTTDEREKSNVLRNRESREEGIAGYIWTSGSDACGDDGYQGDYAPNDVPVIYSGSDYRGRSLTIDRDWNGDNDWDGSPYTISSIVVPRGWTVVLYSGRNYRGQSYELTNNAAFSRGDSWYNRIRSIRVYRGYPSR